MSSMDDAATIAQLYATKALRNGALPELKPCGTETEPSAYQRSAEDMMAFFKVLPCPRKYNHDWQYCFYKHQNEKASRRSLQEHPHAAILCPDMLSKGHCQQGDACTMAHSVFEYWLHPDKFRTKLCTDGEECRRSVCFFAHSPEELRTPSAARVGHAQPPPPPPPPPTAPGSSSGSSSSVSDASYTTPLATTVSGLEVLSAPAMHSSFAAAGMSDDHAAAQQHNGMWRCEQLQMQLGPGSSAASIPTSAQPPPPPAPGSKSRRSSSSGNTYTVSLAASTTSVEVLSAPGMSSSSSSFAGTMAYGDKAGRQDQSSRCSSRQLPTQAVSRHYSQSPNVHSSLSWTTMQPASSSGGQMPVILTTVPCSVTSDGSPPGPPGYFRPGSAGAAPVYGSSPVMVSSSGCGPNPPGIVVGTAGSGGEAAGAGLHHSFQQQQPQQPPPPPQQQQQQVFIPAAGMNDRTAAQLQRLQQLQATANAVAEELSRLRLECSRSMQEAELANPQAEAASRDLEALVAAAAAQQGMSPPNYGAAACSSAAGSGSNYVIMQHSPTATSMASSSCSMSPVAPVSRLLQLGSQTSAGMSLLLPEQELSVRAAGANGAAAGMVMAGTHMEPVGGPSRMVLLQQPVMQQPAMQQPAMQQPMMVVMQEQQQLGMSSSGAAHMCSFHAVSPAQSVPFAGGAMLLPQSMQQHQQQPQQQPQQPLGFGFADQGMGGMQRAQAMVVSNTNGGTGNAGSYMPAVNGGQWVLLG